jgi:hypothetical protein
VFASTGFLLTGNSKAPHTAIEWVIGIGWFVAVLWFFGTHDRLNNFLGRLVMHWRRDEQSWRDARDMHRTTMNFFHRYANSPQPGATADPTR